MRTRARPLFAVFASLVALGATLTTSGIPASACEAAPPLRFRAPVFIDRERHGGEPVSVVADDGSIVVAAHRGTTHLHPRSAPEPMWYATYTNQTYVWRSEDGGDTWSRVEVLPGMHSALSSGFSDPALAKDDEGNLYGVELNAGELLSVFSSHDNGKTWPDANPVSGIGDRPWIAARGNGTVYLKAESNLYTSRDGGRSWASGRLPFSTGDLHVDPSDPAGLLLAGNGGVWFSRDEGRTWTLSPIPGFNRTTIPQIGVEPNGWVHYGFVQSGRVLFTSRNPATGTWLQPVEIPRVGDGTPLWPWTVAGDGGRAAVAWYEAKGTSGLFRSEVRVYVAVTTNATDTACPPSFSVADAVGRPVHVGEDLCSGLTCNLAPDSDRRLGDFFTVNHDAQGRVFVATGDTTLRDPVTGLEYQTSRPLFVGADDDSPRLLAP